MRPVPGFPGYAVTDTGEVWSCRPPSGRGTPGPWRRLKPTPARGGYLQVALCSGAGTVPAYRRVHQLVLEAFVGPCPEGMEACHGDGNVTNNRLDNLRWDTPLNNHGDKRRLGTTARGSRHGRARLDEAAVRAIRREYDRYSRARGARALAQKYGVGRSTIVGIVNGTTWLHLED